MVKYISFVQDLFLEDCRTCTTSLNLDTFVTQRQSKRPRSQWTSLTNLDCNPCELYHQFR